MITRRFVLLVVAVLVGGCTPQRPRLPPGTVPRQPADSVSVQDEQYGHEVLSQLAEKYPLDRNDEHVSRVRAVVDRLAAASGSDQNPWHVYVLQGPDVANAAATRGNYVFVWTGLLSQIRQDDELAAVLAHETGHVLAGHTMANPADEANEILSQVVGQVAQTALSSTTSVPGGAVAIAGALISEGVKAAVIYPESQRTELEADQIGLFLMADAGYDPEAAVSFWERMQRSSTISDAPLQFLSTHPSTGDRIAQLKRYLPEAEKRYEYAVATGHPLDSRGPDGRGPADAFAYGAPSGRGPADRRPPPDVFSQNEPRSRELSPADRGGRWTVMSDHVPVFNDTRSRTPAGFLDRGQNVEVVRFNGRWAEISSPQAGYVRQVMLRRL